MMKIRVATMFAIAQVALARVHARSRSKHIADWAIRYNQNMPEHGGTKFVHQAWHHVVGCPQILSFATHKTDSNVQHKNLCKRPAAKQQNDRKIMTIQCHVSQLGWLSTTTCGTPKQIRSEWILMGMPRTNEVHATRTSLLYWRAGGWRVGIDGHGISIPTNYYIMRKLQWRWNNVKEKHLSFTVLRAELSCFPLHYSDRGVVRLVPVTVRVYYHSSCWSFLLLHRRRTIIADS